MAWKKILIPLFLIIVALTAGLGGAVAGGAAVYLTLQRTALLSQAASVGIDNPAVAPTPSTHLEISSTQIETTITQSVEKVGPAVVTVVGVIPGQQSFFFSTPDQEVSGSGVILSADGYIITNNHVVENTRDVAVILANGDQRSAKTVGTDLYADLAVLKIDGEVPAVAKLGDSGSLKPGESVIAIGSPLGNFKNTVTVGVVSATDRVLDTGNGYQMEGLIQTDAAINQGNSGGPLINLAGEVIGINTLIVRGNGFGSAVAEGLGFAIPAQTVHTVAGDIIAKGYYSRPSLGIQWQPITPRIAAAYRLPVDWGVYVTQVTANGPADHAGVQVGDIITKIGDIPLDEGHSYLNTLFNYTPGETVILTVSRDSKVIEITVTFGEARTQNSG